MLFGKITNQIFRSGDINSYNCIYIVTTNFYVINIHDLTKKFWEIKWIGTLLTPGQKEVLNLIALLENSSRKHIRKKMKENRVY